MNTPFSILFEDQWLLALDKPAGLLVAPDRWDNDLDNLMRLVREHTCPTCFNVHGLDRDASGVVLCAKTKAMKQTACGMFESGRTLREYVTIVRGTPPTDNEGVIDLPIAPDPHHPGRMRTVTAHGTPAETRFRVIERWGGFAVLSVIPLTNRVHQIRVHLAAIHAPIVADAMYGDGFGLALSEIKPNYKQKNTPEKPLLARLALHASALSFDHPVTGCSMSVQAPLPEKFEIAIKYLRRFANLQEQKNTTVSRNPKIPSFDRRVPSPHLSVKLS